jgi:hypothetical protein
LPLTKIYKNLKALPKEYLTAQGLIKATKHILIWGLEQDDCFQKD